MYFPYVRAKQYDLAAIVDLNNAIYASNKVVPIIEPVAASIRPNQYKKLADRDIPFILVVNPTVGTFRSSTPHPDIINPLINITFNGYAGCTLGFIIQRTTTIREVNQFIANFPNHTHAFIHFAQFPNSNQLSTTIDLDANKEYNIFIDRKVSLDYINDFAGIGTTDVLIRDGFIKQVRNEDYPDEDFFSDLYKNYNIVGCISNCRR